MEFKDEELTVGDAIEKYVGSATVGQAPPPCRRVNYKRRVTSTKKS